MSAKNYNLNKNISKIIIIKIERVKIGKKFISSSLLSKH